MHPSVERNQIMVALLAILLMKQTMLGRRAISKQIPEVTHPITTAMQRSMREIPQLVSSIDNYKCSEGLVVVKDSIDSSFYEKEKRRIPKVIHMISKTRCMTRAFAANVDSWRFQGHSLFLHDDDAVDRLLNRWWPEFPNIQDLKNCMMPGAAIADLWRYVLLWEYGGIYTDINNSPGPWFWNETGSVITDVTDALFEQERDGFPSQYFFAASPHHPIMYLAVQNALLRVMEVKSMMRQYVPFVTGPGAIKSAVVSASFSIFATLRWLFSYCCSFSALSFCIDPLLL